MAAYYINRIIAGNLWLFTLRLVLGGILITAGIGKILYPAGFSSVAGFIIPLDSPGLVSLILPSTEILAGCLLILGLFPILTSSAAILLTLVFAVVNVQGIMSAAGSCGCFGKGLPLSHIQALGLDASMFLMAIILYFSAKGLKLSLNKRHYQLASLVLVMTLLVPLSPVNMAQASVNPISQEEPAPQAESTTSCPECLEAKNTTPFGPQRTSPDMGTPKHAYSPFDKKEAPTHVDPFVPGQVLIKMKPDAAGGVRAGTLGQLGVKYGFTAPERVFPNAKAPAPATRSPSTPPSRGLDRWFRAKLPAGKDVLQTVKALSADGAVQAAEPDYLRRPTALPDATTDPRYGEQWHLNTIHAREAWQFLESQGINPGGNRDVVVAVIDTGVDYNHSDLAANIWVNSAEFNGTPGVDDDGNGFVDDIHGCNVVSNQHSGNPMDDHGHGTHVAGIIAAQANNGQGGVGVAYNTQVMPIKAAQYSGVLSTSDIAEAIYYAVEKGADVINMSFGGYSKSQIEEDALAVAFGQAVLVAAAGNDGKVNQPCPFGMDMYPAAYNWVLGVMASTQSGGLASFSNTDCTPHDTHEYELMAPGVDILSTLPGNQYAAWDGTSMAAPVVSGIAALVRSYRPDKDVYSSRFIMGQIAANGADAYNALTVAPKPELSYLEHWLFDTTAQAAGNDADGIVDSGETIDLAIVIRNHWGKAENVNVNLRAWAQGAVQDDPYVTFATSTVNYGAVGSFNWDDNGLIYDAQGVITGVLSPFRFTVSPECYNDHVIPFLLTMTCINGYNPSEPVYTFTSRFNLMVQRGRELPKFMSAPNAFGEKTDYATGNYPSSVMAADVNGDTKPDLTVANRDSNTVSVLLNNGNGTFAAKVDYAVGSSPSSVTISDFNGDSKTDIAVANSGSNTVSILLNNGDGTFVNKVDYGTGNNPSSVAVADFNSDSKPDLAVANYGSNTASILLNNGDGTFATKVDYATGNNPRSVDVADFNGDSKPDMAVVNYSSNTFSILLNNGNGTFAAKVDYATREYPLSIAAADFNADSRADLVIANSVYLSIVLNGGSGTFNEKDVYRVGTPNSVIASDLNGDGNIDIVASCQSGAAVILLLNAGNCQFSTKGYAVGASNYSVSIADFNEDAKADIATANTNNTISVLLGTGNLIAWDMILNKDYFWIVPGQTRIEGGVAVKVTEGTQIQFGAPKPSDPYSEPTSPYIQSLGYLCIEGTYEEPVELFPSPILGGGVTIDPAVLRYTKVRNPSWSIYSSNTLIDHAYFDGRGYVSGAKLNNSIIKGSVIAHSGYYGGQQTHQFNVNLLSVSGGEMEGSGAYDTWKNSVFLNGRFSLNAYALKRYNNPEFINNAFLSKYWNPNINSWFRFYSDEQDWYMPNNYWGTVSTTLIDAAIHDHNDDFNAKYVYYQPILTTPAESTYPFVWKLDISQGGQNVTRLGPGETIFTVTFNRDMDTSVQPAVSFGPDTPVTDYTVHPINGGWQNPRVWQGTFNINPITGDGYQLMRIAGPARAASDHWLVIGDDSGRFRFEIITSGTEAMNLQATGAEGRIDLMWTQNDFDLLAGYNLYRATTVDGSYTRINTTLIPAAQKTFQDTSVQPGQPYFYKFAVVKTTMEESKFSNIASATPTDTIPPVITHTPIASAAPGMGLQISADVTDNVSVASVTLKHRHVGETNFQSRGMVKTTGNRYSATLEGSLVTAPGIEYYIEATDGVSIVRSGRIDLPYLVNVVDAPQVTGITPNHGPAEGNTTVTISGTNFKTGASVTFGGAVAGSVVLVSASQLTCVTPPHFPGVVDVVVSNQDGASGTLLRAFTYESNQVPVSLPDITGDGGAIIEIPVNAENVQGLLSAQVTLQFNSSILTSRGARTGTITHGFAIECNTTTPGEVRLSLASATAISGSGVLAYLEFLVNGAPSASSDLTLVSVSLNDGAIPATLDNGTFTVKDLLDVSGHVYYYQANRAVSGVALTLAGNQSFSQSTDAAGSYTLGGISTGSYTLTPGKSDDATAITSYDASLVLQASVGLITLSSWQQKAADVDKSGSVTPMDASYVLQRSAQLIDLPFPGAGRVWDFDPASRSYQPLSADQANQDFTAILIGDVSGSWGEGRAGGTRVKTGSVGLTIPEVPASPAGQVNVPVRLTATSSQLYSADIVLSYNSAVVSAVQVNKSPLSNSFSIAVNLNKPGEARIAMAGATPIISGGELLTLSFTVTGNAGQTSQIQIASADFNEGALSTQLQNGGVTVAAGRVLPGIAMISNIRSAPSAYESWQVSLDGQFRGWEPGHGSPPFTRSDWVIKDSTGAIYVTGSSPGLRYPNDVGKPVNLNGVVRQRNGFPYIELIRR